MAFNRRFWIGLLVSAALCAAGLHGFARTRLAAPSLGMPRLPVSSAGGYLSASDSGEVDQALFYFGLLGFGERIRTADILVLGSSHAMFGLSAEQLADAYSSATGRAVSSFNMALGNGEGLRFARMIGERLRPDAVHAIADPFGSTADGLSMPAREALRGGPINGYARVFTIWLDYLRDRTLEAVLPRARLKPGSGLTFGRFLRGAFVFRDWQTGEVHTVWSPEGEMFWGESSAHGHPLERQGSFHVDPLSERELAFLRTLSPGLALTLVPYPSYDEAWARQIAAQIGAPFLAIDPDGLLYWDHHHLTAASRAAATLQIIAGLANDRSSRPSR